MIDVRVMYKEGEDQIWSGPIRNRQALDALMREHGERNIATWLWDDPHSLDCADTVLRLSEDRFERTYGAGRYCIAFGRLRPPTGSVTEGTVTAPAQLAAFGPVYGGFPLLEDRPEVRAPQTIAGGTRNEVPRETSLPKLTAGAWCVVALGLAGAVCRIAWQAFGDWLLNRRGWQSRSGGYELVRHPSEDRL
jgi:hypothetical protein